MDKRLYVTTATLYILAFSRASLSQNTLPGHLLCLLLLTLVWSSHSHYPKVKMNDKKPEPVPLPLFRGARSFQTQFPIFEAKIPQKMTLKIKKQTLFFWGWRLIFLALKPSPQCHQTFVKVGFPGKVTGLWAFEGQMSYQKYQGSPIVVGCWANFHSLCQVWVKIQNIG